jgi:hypothetical protein
MVMLIMSVFTAAIAFGAADFAWRHRVDADLRRRWRTRRREPWRLT